MASENYLKYRQNFPQNNTFTGIRGAPETEFSNFFVQGMANRMAVSYHKYGPVSEAYPEKVDAIESLKTRLKLYLEGGEIKGQKIAPGNTEYLIDAANFAMIEFMHPKHPKAFFKVTDSDGSPGRVWNDGNISEAGHGKRQAEVAVQNFYSKRGQE
jgi:hypothetical protein